MTPSDLEKLERLADGASLVFNSEDAYKVLSAVPQLIAEVRKLREALEGAVHRFDLIHAYTECIGTSLCHVDGNCPQCVSVFAAKLARDTLGEKP